MKLNQWQIVGLIIIIAALAFYGYRNYGGGSHSTTSSISK